MRILDSLFVCLTPHLLSVLFRFIATIRTPNKIKGPEPGKPSHCFKRSSKLIVWSFGSNTQIYKESSERCANSEDRRKKFCSQRICSRGNAYTSQLKLDSINNDQQKKPAVRVCNLELLLKDFNPPKNNFFMH